MKALKLLAVVVSTCAIVFATAYALTNKSGAAISELSLARIEVASDASHLNSPALRYRLDASRSKFIAHAGPGGLLWFKGHGHDLAIREFTGEAQLTPDSITPASLEITAKAASMEETSSAFTEPQKQIINKELREIVLLPNQYPDRDFFG